MGCLLLQIRIFIQRGTQQGESGLGSIHQFIQTISFIQTSHPISFTYHTIQQLFFIESFNMGRMYGKG